MRLVAGSNRTTRDGAASSRSKNKSSTPVAVLENRLKLTPPSMTVAPRGLLLPMFFAEAPAGEPPRVCLTIDTMSSLMVNGVVVVSTSFKPRPIRCPGVCTHTDDYTLRLHADMVCLGCLN